ncbi:hypothetical protein HY636_06095 [Candidatus Woesearchaeota archaeon]|nr:hypothetical protein [Candidatus Woesearchaeota archaeon]
MDDKTQKERLEQELRFLKESFEAEVISKEEFEKGKERIEKKLKEITHLEEGQTPEEQDSKEEQKKEQIIEKEEETVKAEEQKKDSSVETIEAEKIKLNVIQDEIAEHEYFEPVQIKTDDTKRVNEPSFETIKTEHKEDKKKGRFFRYAVVFVVLMLVAFLLYSVFKDNKEVQKETQDKKQSEVNIEKTNVILLNDRKNCFNCDTQRVLSILENWFGAINPKEVDYNTKEGKNIAEKFNAKLLPMYILDENITKKPKFEEFRQIFVRRDDIYLLSEDASGSTFYFRRNNVPKELDLFVISGDNASIKAERNLKEFLEVFKEIKFQKHLSNDNLAKELGIKNFPAFLVNNQVKFSGVHTAETIKSNFCKLNELEACEKSLSKSLI